MAKLTLTMTEDELFLIRKTARERGYANAAIFAKEHVVGYIISDIARERQKRSQQAGAPKPTPWVG